MKIGRIWLPVTDCKLKVAHFGCKLRYPAPCYSAKMQNLEKNDIKSNLLHDVASTLHRYLKGDWKNITAYNEELANQNLNLGDSDIPSLHFHWLGWPHLYQGEFDIPELMVEKLIDTYEVYENEFTLMLIQLLNTGLLLERRKLHDALAEIEKGVSFSLKTNSGLPLIHLYSCKAQVNILMRDAAEAEKNLNRADRIRREVDTAPWQLSHFLRGRSIFDLYMLEEAVGANDGEAVLRYRARAKKSTRALLRQSRKVAQHRTDSRKMRGLYYWLIGNQKSALKWWRSAIENGEGLGARLELSRTFLEIGKRLLEPGSQHKSLNGVEAEAYLEKARALFTDMDLQWDLDELDRITM